MSYLPNHEVVFEPIEQWPVEETPDPVRSRFDTKLSRTLRELDRELLHLGRGERVLRKLRGAGVRLHALRLTRGGHPSHPLYLPKNTKPFLCEPA